MSLFRTNMATSETISGKRHWSFLHLLSDGSAPLSNNHVHHHRPNSLTSLTAQNISAVKEQLAARHDYQMISLPATNNFENTAFTRTARVHIRV